MTAVRYDSVDDVIEELRTIVNEWDSSPEAKQRLIEHWGFNRRAATDRIAAYRAMMNRLQAGMRIR